MNELEESQEGVYTPLWAAILSGTLVLRYCLCCHRWHVLKCDKVELSGRTLDGVNETIQCPTGYDKENGYGTQPLV